MKLLVALVSLACLVLGTAANAQEVRIDLRGIMPAADVPRAPALTFDRGLFRAAPVVGPEAPRVPAQLRAAKRRGSMVGYLDDPVIGSKVRIRFESGFHNDTPDRAEYFYAKCGCYATLFSPGDPEYDADAPGPGPGIIGDLNFRQMYFQGEYSFGTRVSAFAELPLRWVQPQVVTNGTFENQGGLGDIRAGVKVALASSAERTVTLQVRSVFPTGDPAKGLGADHASLEPAVLYLQQAGARVTVEAQGGFWLPLGGSHGVPTSVDQKFAGNMFFYGIGPSYEVYRGSRVSVSPVVELIGWHVIDGFQTAAIGDASGTDIVNIKFGARINWNDAGSIYVGYGRALTDARWYRDIFRLEYRHGF